MKVKILGYGEIGRSLAEVYRSKGIDVAWKDIIEKYGDDDCELLNVCIPYNNLFIKEVLKEILLCGAKYLVIHSTVPPGTTSEILNKIKITGCHSPVIGVHPNLSKSLITFKKWFGGGTKEIYDHFESIGIMPKILKTPEATEIMKLWDTTYYGMCLAINAEVQSMLENYNLDYSDWVEYLKEYNNGYFLMNKKNVQRPFFEKLEMPIGGHCVVPNYKMLSKFIDKDLLKIIEKYSSSNKKTTNHDLNEFKKQLKEKIEIRMDELNEFLDNSDRHFSKDIEYRIKELDDLNKWIKINEDD